MLAIGSIVWGVRDIPLAIKFWSEALTYTTRDSLPTDQSELDWCILLPRSGRKGVQLALMQVKGKPDSPQRHHLDVYASNVDEEVERLVKLGAKRAERTYPEGVDYIVLEDPDGNPFCVCDKANWKGYEDEVGIITGGVQICEPYC